MIRNRLLIFFLFITLPINLLAQNFSLSMGANHSWFIYPSEFPLENEFNPNYSLGINFNQNVFQNTNISMGLRFFKVGRYDEITTNSTTEKAEINHLYITLTFKAEYQLLNNFFPFINIEPGIQLQSKFKHTNSLGLNDNRTITDEMNTFNIFTGVGIKYLFNIYNQELSLSSLINFGLLRISKDEQFDITEDSSRGWIDWKAREILIAIDYYISI